MRILTDLEPAVGWGTVTQANLFLFVLAVVLLSLLVWTVTTTTAPSYAEEMERRQDTYESEAPGKGFWAVSAVRKIYVGRKVTALYNSNALSTALASV